MKTKRLCALSPRREAEHHGSSSVGTYLWEHAAVLSPINRDLTLSQSAGRQSLTQDKKKKACIGQNAHFHYVQKRQWTVTDDFYVVRRKKVKQLERNPTLHHSHEKVNWASRDQLEAWVARDRK